MAPILRSLALSVAVALVVSGCGGGGSAGIAPPTAGGSSTSGLTALTFLIPSKSTSARRAKVLPATTQSVQINVTSGTATPLASPVPPDVINVVAGINGCSSVSGGITCTETMTVPFGTSLLFTIVAY